MYHAHALPNETLNFTAFFVVFGQRSLVWRPRNSRNVS